MRRLRDIILVSLTVAVGIAIGFGTHRTSNDARRMSVSSPVADAALGERTPGASPAARVSAEPDRFTPLVSALRESETLAGRVELFRLISDLSAAELPALIERAKGLPLKYRKELIAALFERWMTIDRASAESWIRRQGSSSECYAAWARTNPEAALQHIFATENHHAYLDIVGEALTRMAGNDWRARLDILARFPPSPASRRNLHWQFDRWSESDPASALSWLSVLPDDGWRESLVKTALTALANRDPAAATKRIQEMIPQLEPTVLGNSLTSEFARSLAEKDATLAMEFAGQLTEELRLFPLIAAGCAWAKSDPIAALDWALQNGIDPMQQFRTETETYTMCILRNAMSQPDLTVEWLLAQPASTQRDRWLREALFKVQWKTDHTPWEAEGDVALRLFNSLSSEGRNRAAYDMGDKLVGSGNFPAMDAWASMFPDETVRAGAIGGAVGNIFKKTPDRAEAIVADLPEGAVRDQGLAALAGSKSFTAPAAAAANALEIRDPEVRYGALDDVVNRWMRRDRQSAQAWLDTQSDLPREWVAEWAQTESNH